MAAAVCTSIRRTEGSAKHQVGGLATQLLVAILTVRTTSHNQVRTANKTSVKTPGLDGKVWPIFTAWLWFKFEMHCYTLFFLFCCFFPFLINKTACRDSSKSKVPLSRSNQEKKGSVQASPLLTLCRQTLMSSEVRWNYCLNRLFICFDIHKQSSWVLWVLRRATPTRSTGSVYPLIPLESGRCVCPR